MKDAAQPGLAENYDPDRCWRPVYHPVGAGGYFSQCARRGIIKEHGGRWCGNQHLPSSVEERQQARAKCESQRTSRSRDLAAMEFLGRVAATPLGVAIPKGLMMQLRAFLEGGERK